MIIVRRSRRQLSLNVNKQVLMSFVTLSPTMSNPAPSTKSSPPSTSNSAGAAAAAGTSQSTGGGQSQSWNWSYVLSPENKAKTIQLLNLDKENVQNSMLSLDVDRKAAVLIPLCYDKSGKPSLLYNLRSQNVSKHRGEISFPGGTIDPEDQGDPIAAALRETHEELGITSDSIEIWTTLRPFPTVSSNMGVTPVLGSLKHIVDPVNLKICEDEVDHAFTVTLEQLCDPNNWEDGTKRKWKGHTFHMPTWKNLNVFNGTDVEEVPLWGLTAFVTHITLLALLPSEVYQRTLPYLKLQLKPKSSSDPKL